MCMYVYVCIEIYDEDNVKDILKQTSYVRRSLDTTDVPSPSLTVMQSLYLHKSKFVVFVKRCGSCRQQW